MTSSIGAKSGVARHGRVIASVILVQSLIIVWLSSWVLGDYSNNQYVRAYVDSTIQSLMWVFGAVIIVGVLGSVLGLIVRRRHGSGLELVGVSPRVPVSTPVAKSTMSVSRGSASLSRTAASTPISTSAPGPKVTTVSSTGVEVSAPKPAAELHPAVAALKAELSEARMSLGLASVTTGPTMPSGPATKFEDQRTPQSTQMQPQLSHSPIIPRPQNPVVSQNIPPTVIRPMAPPPTVIRPMTPATGSGAQPSTPPMLRPAGPPSQPSPHPMGVPARPETVPTPPADVSTVITGIMPVLKKKDEAASSSDQSNQQKQ